MQTFTWNGAEEWWSLYRCVQHKSVTTMLLTDIMGEYARYMVVTDGINASQVGIVLSVVYGQAVSPT